MSVIFVTLFGPAAFAQNFQLYQWIFNVDGQIYDSAGVAGPYALPSAFSATPSLVGPQAGEGPQMFTITVSGGGNHQITAYFNYDVNSNFYQEYAASSGTAPTGFTWQTGDPATGNLFAHVLAGAATLDGTHALTSTSLGDAATAMGWQVDLVAGETATLSFTMSNTAPAGGFYITQSNAFSSFPRLYLSSALAKSGSVNGCYYDQAGMTAWWRGDGNAKDAGGLFHGTLGGNVTFAPGLIGQAFSFDGSQSPYVSIPAGVFPFPGQQPFSFDTWFKTSSNGVILGQQAGSPYGAPLNGGAVPAIYVGGDGRLRAELFWSGSIDPVTSDTTVNDGVFHHVAVTYDGNTEIVYLDGAAIGSRTVTQTSYAASYQYQLGTGYSSGWPGAGAGWFTFNGLIDEPTVYSRALSASEVGQLGGNTAGKCALLSVITVQTIPIGQAITVDGVATTAPQSFTWLAETVHSIAVSGTINNGLSRLLLTDWSNGGSASQSYVVPSTDTTITATYKLQHSLITQASPPALGSIAASPSSGDGYYDAGTQVQLTATPVAANVFFGWSGGKLGGKTNPSTVTLTTPSRVNALFGASALTGCVIMPVNLTAGWKGNGNASDITGNFNGTMGRNTAFSTGLVGQAFFFDGSQSPYVSIPSGVFPFPGSQPFSFETWFKTSSGGVILGQHGGTVYGAGNSLNGSVPALYVGTDGLLRAQFFWGGNIDPITSSVTVNDGQFHHAAVTYDGTTEVAYLDGAAIGSRAMTQVGYTSPYQYELGTGYTANYPATTGLWYTFNGLIDETGVYSRALGAAEIAQIVAATSDGKCAPQTISFAALVPQASGTSFAPIATATSGLAVSLISATPGVCTVSGGTVLAAAPGICTIQATQGGAGNYLPAPVVPQSFTVVPIRNSIVVGAAAGSASVILPTNSGWTASTDSSFLHITAGSAVGNGSAVVAFHFDDYTGTGTRSGTLTIAGLPVTVIQAGTNYRPIPPPLNCPACGLSYVPFSPAGYQPWLNAVDSADNIYFTSSTVNPGVYKWSFATKQISLLPGTGGNVPYGVAVDNAGNVYYSLYNTGTLLKWTASNQQIITLADGLAGAWGVAADAAGNVYVAEYGAGRVRMWSATTQQVATLVSGLGNPTGVAVDLAGNVYIADSNVITFYNAFTKQVSTLFSGLNNVVGVAVDGSGTVYTTSYFGSDSVQRWSPATQQSITLLNSQSIAFNANPVGVAVDDTGNVFFTNFGAGLVNNTLFVLPQGYIGPSPQSVSSAAGAGSVSLLPASQTTEWAPMGSSDITWLTTSIAGRGTINYAFSNNYSGATRNAAIVALGQQVTVSQSAASGQSLAFGALSDRPFGIPPFTVSASASSGLPVTFSSTTQTICSVSGTTVTLIGLGTCTIRADQLGNGSFAPVNASQSFQVTQGMPAITFAFLGNQALGTGTATVSATASAGMTVSYASLTANTCTLSGTTLTLVGLGTCTVQGSVTGDANYAAGSATQSFLVVQLPSTMAIGSAAGTSSILLPMNGPWTAASNDSFLHISGGSGSGTGKAVVAFTYDAFAAAGVRSGTLTIAGLTFTVIQAGTNYTATTGNTTIASSGLIEPTLQTVDAAGNLYIADNTGAAIRRYSATSGQLTTLVSSPSTTLSHPFDVTLDGAGNVYFVDNSGTSIRMWSPVTQQVTALPNSSTGAGYAGIVSDAVGNIYYARGISIGVWSASTQQATVLATYGALHGIAVDLAGNLYYVSGTSVVKWDPATRQSTTIISSGLSSPNWLAVDGFGNLFISDLLDDAIKSWNASTQQLTTVMSLSYLASGVAVDVSGNIYAAGGFNASAQVTESVRAWVPTANVNEPAGAGSDSLAVVLPVATNLSGVLAPAGDQSWLTINGASSGVVSYSFTTNGGASARTANLTVLGQQVPVIQAAGSLLTQSITFGALTDQASVVAPLTLNATASSGLAVGFASTTVSVCTVSGTTLTLWRTGVCTIHATQPGDAVYAAAASINRSFTIGPVRKRAGQITSQ